MNRTQSLHRRLLAQHKQIYVGCNSKERTPTSSGNFNAAISLYAAIILRPYALLYSLFLKTNHWLLMKFSRTYQVKIHMGYVVLRSASYVGNEQIIAHLSLLDKKDELHTAQILQADISAALNEALLNLLSVSGMEHKLFLETKLPDMLAKVGYGCKIDAIYQGQTGQQRYEACLNAIRHS